MVRVLKLLSGTWQCPERSEPGKVPVQGGKEEAGPRVKMGSLWLHKRNRKDIVNMDGIIVEEMHSPA